MKKSFNMETRSSLQIIVLVIALASLVPAVMAQSSKEVCIEGYVMDKYCIDLGVLLDNRAVKTLENPELHSVHCLVDVSLCTNTPFTILVPNPSGSPAFAVGLTLDDFGRQKSIEAARDIGICSTCKSGGSLRLGFRGVFFGSITQQATDTEPAVFSVKNVTVSPLALNSSASSNGCPVGSSNLNLTTFTQSGELKVPSIAHGSLMIIGWGLLLPTGVASARFLKHRPNAMWFKIHRMMQILGLVVAICGWGVALAKFTALESPGTDSFNHGVMGMTVMVLGLLQPLNAFFRPHPADEGEEKPMKRLLWEILHKASGYIAIFLAAATIAYGTTVIFGHNTEFQVAWVVTLVWVVSFSLYCIYDGYVHNKKNSSITASYTK